MCADLHFPFVIYLFILHTKVFYFFILAEAAGSSSKII